MADIEVILGADNGHTPDSLAQMYPKVNRNFAELNAEVAELSDASGITYSGDVVGADTVEEAIDALNEIVDAAIVEGDSSPQASAAAISISGTTYATLKARLDAEYTLHTTQIADKASISALATKVSKGELVYNALDYGAVGNGSHNDTSFIQAAIDATPPGCNCYLPGNKNYIINSTLNINQTINFICDGYISYTGTTGAAIAVLPTPTPSGLYNCTIRIANMQQVGGNTGMPSSVNTSGAIGIKINSLISSRIDLGNMYGFTYAGLFLDGRGLINSNPQVIAHNLIDIRTIANCGIGILCLSTDAATSNVEVNDFRIAWMLQNYTGIQLDNSTAYGATSSNDFDITAIDNAYYRAIDCYGSFNEFDITFMSSNLVWNAQSSFNTASIGNNVSSDALVTYGGICNRVITAVPNPSVLPVTSAVVNGTNYQNTFGVPITIYLRAYATTSGTPGFVHASVGDSSASTLAYTKQVPGSSTSGQPEVLVLRVPSGWHYRFDAGAVTLGTGTLVGE